MNSILVALTTLGCTFGASLLGLALRRILPADHLTADSKDAVKVGAGMISVMTALVLGLLVSSAKQHFDSADTAVVQGSARLILLDRVLASYGPEFQELRAQLRQGLVASIAMLWPEDHVDDSLSAFEKSTAMETLARQIRELKPETDAQRDLRQQAHQICNDLMLSR